MAQNQERTHKVFAELARNQQFAFLHCICNEDQVEELSPKMPTPIYGDSFTIAGEFVFLTIEFNFVQANSKVTPVHLTRLESLCAMVTAALSCTSTSIERALFSYCECIKGRPLNFNWIKTLCHVT